MANVIELNKVNKIFGDKVKHQVLYDIDFIIKKGEFVSIIGQSGSGKSTLLNIVGTLDKPSSGTIKINNLDTKSLNDKQLSSLRNKTIGFIFQFHYLLDEFNVIENVLMPFRISNNKVGAKQRERAIELLSLVGLSDKINYKISMLSGGQQQRVAIARALMNDPEIILADEPTGNLDSINTKSIYELLRRINKENSTTFIIITHDNNIALEMDRIIEIKDGRISNDTLK
ncbi:MAG: ABC transporter ATP-binding protein [Erysipelotrichales bacterium]